MSGSEKALQSHAVAELHISSPPEGGMRCLSCRSASFLHGCRIAQQCMQHAYLPIISLLLPSLFRCCTRQVLGPQRCSLALDVWQAAAEPVELRHQGVGQEAPVHHLQLLLLLLLVLAFLLLMMGEA